MMTKKTFSDEVNHVSDHSCAILITDVFLHRSLRAKITDEKCPKRLSWQGNNFAGSFAVNSIKMKIFVLRFTSC